MNEIKPEVALAILAINPAAKELGYKVSYHSEEGISALCVEDSSGDFHALNIKSTSVTGIIATFGYVAYSVEIGDGGQRRFHLEGDDERKCRSSCDFSSSVRIPDSEKVKRQISDLQVMSITTPMPDLARDYVQDAIEALSKAVTIIANVEKAKAGPKS